jgi:hypothetical protein
MGLRLSFSSPQYSLDDFLLAHHNYRRVIGGVLYMKDADILSFADAKFERDLRLADPFTRQIYNALSSGKKEVVIYTPIEAGPSAPANAVDMEPINEALKAKKTLPASSFRRDKFPRLVE